MIFLLGELRREMNGAVADAMRYYGSRYGLNYGVSLPTIRSIAAKEPQDNDLALYLFKQDVRELRLAALHIAEPSKFEDSTEEWRNGITTSEIAEEMAFALLRHVESIEQLYHDWSQSGDELATYAVIMAATRSRIASECATIDPLPAIIARHPHSRLIAQAAVALLSTAMQTLPTGKIKTLIEELPPCKATDYINEEMAWRME